MKLRLYFYKYNKTPYDKNMKRDHVSADIYIKRDTLLPLYASVNILDDPLVTCILNG